MKEATRALNRRRPRMAGWILVFFLLLSLVSCARVANPELRRELLSMLEKDQAIREEYLVVTVPAASTPLAGTAEVFVPREALDPSSQALFDQLKALDEGHTARMKEILDQVGWPGYALVGEDGSDAAWVLVQHSGDLAFQKRCLALLTEAAGRGDAAWRHVAYLTDRVRVGEGKPQVYGTQFKPEGGRMVPFPIEDEANVNARRREVGLPTLEEYRQQMNQHLEHGQ